MRKTNTHIATYVALAIATATTPLLARGEGGTQRSWEGEANVSSEAAKSSPAKFGHELRIAQAETTSSQAPQADTSKLSSRVTFDIPAQPLSASLKQLADQAGIQILFEERVVSGIKAPSIKANQSTIETLQALLKDTDLEYTARDQTIAVREKSKTTSLASNGGPIRLAQVEGQNTSESSDEQNKKDTEGASKTRDNELQEVKTDLEKIPEVLVRGTKTLNMDIRRDKNGPLPYVVLDRKAIEKSGARNIDDFLRYNLPMGDPSSTLSSGATPAGNASAINLRGLGVNQTLVLVDGHRTASYSISGSPAQPDLNGIPLAVVERIEVLPTTASGIYGGSATGGVINIVLRRDYEGLEAKLTYGGTYDGGAASRRADISAGFKLEDGKTNLLFAGSYADSDPLRRGARDMVVRGRQRTIDNDPSLINGVFAPPLGLTTNICSADSFGLGICSSAASRIGLGGEVPLTLKSGTELGSSIAFVPMGYAGPDSDSGAALAASGGRYNFGLANTAQVAGGRGSLWNSSIVKSLLGTLRRDFTPSVQGYVSITASSNSSEFASSRVTSSFNLLATDPANPFAEDILVTVPAVGADGNQSSEIRDRKALGGLIVRLPKNWQSVIEYTWDQVRFSGSDAPSSLSGSVNGVTLGQSIAGGAIDVFRDINLQSPNFGQYLSSQTGFSPFNTTLSDATLRLSGPAWALPGGDITISTLLEHRRESIGASHVTSDFRGVITEAFVPNQAQEVDSVYVEARLPIVSERNSIPGIRSMELQLAGRRDDYRTTGAAVTSSSGPELVDRTTSHRSSTDPTVGLRFQPLHDLALRASYGTGFLPPSVSQLAEIAPVPFDGTGLFTDPRRGGESVGLIDVVQGGNPNLNPERSETWSAGAILTPHLIDGLRFSLDWTRLKKNDNLEVPELNQFSVDNEQYLSGFIVRAAPTPQNDPLDYGVGPITRLRLVPINVSRAHYEFFDVAADYRLATSDKGEFTFSAMGTRQTRKKSQFTPLAPVVDGLGLVNALKWKATASIEVAPLVWTDFRCG